MVVIIDYDVGNLESLQRGCTRAGIETIITADSETIKNAQMIILPGVGAFPDAMKSLENTGLIPILNDHVSNGKPLVGICLGMQLLFTSSNEFTKTKGLNYINGTIEELDVSLKIPHMGWNTLKTETNSPLLQHIQDEDYVYFVHSFYAKTTPNNVIAYTQYEVDVPAIVQQGNVIGMQFHPEKSGQVGLTLLQNIKEMFL